MSALAVDTAGEPGHLVRFYHDDAAVLDEVAEFLDASLRHGGAAIVIATSAHAAALRQRLMGFGRSKDAPGWFSGELIMLDATETLDQLMVDGWPDPDRFDAVVGSVVRKAAASGRGLKAFGEMVAVLCQQGLHDAALRLEQLWNRLGEDCDFSLFCAYPWHAFPSESQAAVFRDICTAHDHVRPDLPGTASAPPDISLRLALLEQQNVANQAELARLRHAEQTLRHRERELMDFMENAAEGIHRVAADGTVLWTNKAELALLGYRWEEYVGQHIARFHADQDAIADVLERLKAGQTLSDEPARMVCRDGSIKHVVINSNGYFEDGKLRYTRCFTRDATDRHLLEQAHREREALVAQLSDMNDAKDEFLAMLAHELRNPLAPISAAAQLLELACHDPAKVRSAALMITRQVSHLKGLVDDLLDVARVTRGLITLDDDVFDVRDVVSEAVEQVAPHIRARRHRTVIDLPPAAVTMRGDRKRMIQVAVNLLVNASKFTPNGGEIRIQLQAADGSITLVIADNGIGMDQDILAHAFDLFVQGRRTPDRAQGGLGVGLSLTKKLVEYHRGAIHVHSDGPGKGSTFTIRLPAAMEDAAPAAPATTRRDAALVALDILVVDDNQDAADTLASFLSAIGHKARAEYTPRAALREAQARCPQVFLIDIGLPEMDGNVLAASIRALPSAADAVLVAVTGYGQQQDRDLALAAGFHHHLVKPVDTAELLALLERVAQA